MTPFWAMLTGILIGMVISAIASLALIFGTAYVCELDRIYCERAEEQKSNNDKPISDADENA